MLLICSNGFSASQSSELTQKALQVWNACKLSMEDTDQPNHEIDVLSGHENDVNYVQFRLVFSVQYIILVYDFFTC